MIFYYSGVGNSKYVAYRIGSSIREDVIFIPSANASEQYPNGKSIGFIFPIYSWGIPPIVTEFINNLSSEFINETKRSKIPIWMVCTYGDEIGMSVEMLEKSLKLKGLTLSGAWGVQMPNTYVLLPGFDIDSEEVKKEKLRKAPIKISEICQKVINRNWERNVHKGSFPRLRSMIFPLFKKWGIDPAKWRHDEKCVKCKRCSEVCPVGNIDMKDEGPKWNSKCISCLACFHVCPVHSIEYGKITINKGQYRCPL